MENVQPTTSDYIFLYRRIQRFSIIPLSTNTGLIGWVPNSDTLHSLIREYRDKTDTTLNQEHREMLHLAPDFDRLNLSQKTEVFEAGLRVSSGRDLANILWLKSHNSEVCLSCTKLCFIDFAIDSSLFSYSRFGLSVEQLSSAPSQLCQWLAISWAWAIG